MIYNGCDHFLARTAQIITLSCSIKELNYALIQLRTIRA